MAADDPTPAEQCRRRFFTTTSGWCAFCIHRAGDLLREGTNTYRVLSPRRRKKKTSCGSAEDCTVDAFTSRCLVGKVGTDGS